MSELVKVLQDHERVISSFSAALSNAVKSSKRVITAGNGGSAAIASHMVVDIMKTSKRFDLPSVICLNDNVPLLTAIANDVSYEDSLSLAADLHKVGEGDLVVIVSSSGNSKNVVGLARLAMSRGATVYAMTGFTGGILLHLPIHVCLHIESNDYGVVEDVHHHIMHRLVKELQK